jgi:hypothetical protein
LRGRVRSPRAGIARTLPEPEKIKSLHNATFRKRKNTPGHWNGASCCSEGEAEVFPSNVVRALYVFCIVTNLPSSEKRRLRREVRLATAGLPTAYVLEAMASRLETPWGLLELETVDGFLIRVGRTRYMSPNRPPAYELGPNPTQLDLVNCLGATYGVARGKPGGLIHKSRGCRSGGGDRSVQRVLACLAPAPLLAAGG